MTYAAYVTIRAKKRRRSSGLKRHAVGQIARACGALDSACGQVTAKYIGPWDPDGPDNCLDCIHVLAKEASRS